MNQKTNSCLLCQSPSHLILNKLEGYQEGEVFQVFHCKNCNTSYSHPNKANGSLYDKIYKNGEMIPGYNRYFSYYNRIKDTNNALQFLANSEEDYWGVQQALKTITKNNSKQNILEIGSGLGYLTYALRQENYDIVGLDISANAVEQAKNKFGDFYICADLFEYSKANPGTIDIVILTEVIEHTEEPVAFLNAVKTLLKKDGNIIMTTPNKSIFPNKRLWATDAPPIHLWWFSEKSIETIAKKLDMETQLVKFNDFFKDNPKVYNKKKLGRNNYPNPTFSKQGVLLKQEKYRKPKKNLHTKLKIKLKKLRAIFDNNMMVCSERSDIICAILSNQLTK